MERVGFRETKKRFTFSNEQKSEEVKMEEEVEEVEEDEEEEEKGKRKKEEKVDLSLVRTSSHLL